MAKLSMLFQFSLFVSLFLIHVLPSVQTPGKPAHYIEIYRRDQLLQSKMVNYRSATVTALSRDKARAKSIRGRGALEQNEGIGEYFVQVGFGTPPKKLYTVLDTGSDVTWIQCQPCKDCYRQTDPIFNPAMSTSYKPLPCNSQQCQQLDAPGCNSTRQTCLYEIRYSDGSVTAGDFATETLSFGDTIAIGCGHSNKAMFVKASGVFGLGRGSLSFLSQANYSAFSYCLTDRNSPKPSYLELGSSATFSDAVITTPMLRNSELPSFYFVGLTGISVNGRMLPLPSIDSTTGYSGTIMDCGTTLTSFPQEVYKQVRDAFVEAATGLTFVGAFGPLDTCYALTIQSQANFPTVAFHFGGALLTLPRQNVMFSLYNYTCFAFVPRTATFSIIGNHQQQGIRVSFDQDKSLLGFLPDKC